MWLFFLETISAGDILKCSATILIIALGVISLLTSGEIISLRTSFANSTSTGFFETLEKATILVSAPSNSLILDLILEAMYLIISSFIL